MCQIEIVGDYYKGCGHFHARYENGIKTDCGWKTCANSAHHVHTAPGCGCTPYRSEERIVENTFREVYPGGTDPMTIERKPACKVNKWSEFH